MKAITIRQPWATLIAIGAKRIETRSWATNYRGPLAIHAAINFLPYDHYLCFREPFRKFLVGEYTFIMRGEIYFGKHNFPLGAVIATCELVDCVKIEQQAPSYGCNVVKADRRMDFHMIEYNNIPPAEPEISFGDYTPGRFAWVLENVKPLPKPIQQKGAQRLWEWEESLIRKGWL